MGNYFVVYDGNRMKKKKNKKFMANLKLFFWDSNPRSQYDYTFFLLFYNSSEF